MLLALAFVANDAVPFGHRILSGFLVTHVPNRSHTLGQLKSPALGLRNPITEFDGRVNPKAYGFLSVRQCSLISVTVGHTTRKLRHFGDKGVVFNAPVDDHFVSIHQ